jgi:Domain of Unknown Function with PDB structure (DUF3857)
MKPLLLTCLLFLGIISLSLAQSPVPELGNITAEEKNMTVCPFDKEADAVILLDHATSDYDNEYKFITNRRIRIKILKPSGISNGDIQIPFYSKDDFEYVGDIQAFVYNFDDKAVMKTVQVNRQQIFRQKVNERVSVVKFAMPEVKEGSILEYQYTSTMKNYGGLNDWYFQTELPTVKSYYSLVILPNYEFAYVVHKSSAYPIDIKNEKGSGKVSFEMNDIAGLRDEPYMDAARDYKQYVEFQLSAYTSSTGGKTKYMNTWNDVNRELLLDPNFGRQLNKKLAGSEAILGITKLMESPFKKMSAIYYYVQNNISWNERSGKYSMDGVKNAWETKKGSNADMNLVLINLLQDAGLEVYPLLVSERGNGKVNTTTAFVDQFNTVMAYVLIDNEAYVLDAASYNTPPYLFPYSVVNTTALIVDKKKGGIVTLTEKNRMDKNLIVVTAKMNEDGKVEGSASITSYDYARMKRQHSYKRDKTKFSNDYLVQSVTGLKIDSLIVSGLDADSIPMQQEFNFELPAISTGDYKLLTLNLFTGFEKTPFISDHRFTNIDYGCLQRHQLTEVIQLPAGMQPESLPKDIKLVMPDNSIVLTRFMQYSDNKLQTRYEIRMSKSVFSAEEYSTVKTFYKQMVDIMNEQVVLKKKATP